MANRNNYIKKVTETKTYLVYCSAPSMADAERWATKYRVEIDKPTELVIDPWREMTEVETIFAFPTNQILEE